VVPWFAKPFIKTRISDSLQAYDTVKTLEAFKSPILILGAAKDKTLPVELSQVMAERLIAAGRDVTYVEFPKGNHISIPIQESYAPTIESFIERISEPALKLGSFEVAALDP